MKFYASSIAFSTDFADSTSEDEDRFSFSFISELYSHIKQKCSKEDYGLHWVYSGAKLSKPAA